MEPASRQELTRLLDGLRGRVEPIAARRLACACVRSIWEKVESQAGVSPVMMEQCRQAFALTERSIVEQVAEEELQSIEFEALCDCGGDEAFMAAAHVGWNLFVPPRMKY